MVRRLAPLIVFAVFACLLLWPVLFGGRVLLPGGMMGKMSPWNASATKGVETHWNALTWDSVAYFYPSRTLLGRALKSGEIPLWNPYQMCGAPFLADYQSAVLYPPNWLFAILPADRAFGLLAFLHLFAAGAFTYVFLRGLGLGRMASTFGGVAFMLSGFAITWLELPVFLSTAIWLPLALHFSHAAYETRAGRYAVVAGVAVGLSMLGGHPQIAFYCLLALGMYWVYLSAMGWRKTSVFRMIVLAGLTFGIGFALAAPQLYPAMELAQFSHRGGAVPTMQGYAAYSSLAMPWRNIVTFSMPYFFGNPMKGSYTEFAEYCGYIGILPLLLIIPALGRKARARRHVWFFCGLAALALLMALGTGINRAFYFWAPGFAHSGSPSRALFLFMFSVAILGAMGLDRVLGEAGDRKPTWLLAGLGTSFVFVLAGSITFVYLILSRISGEFTQGEMFAAVSSEISGFVVCLLLGMLALILTVAGKVSREVGGALVIGLLAADLLVFGVGYNPTCKPSELFARTPTIDLITKDSGYGRIMPLNEAWSLSEFPKSILPPNSATAYGMFDVQGYDSLYPVRYKALLDAVAGRDSCPRENGNMVFAGNPQSPVYDLLGVRWIISRNPMPSARKISDGCYVYKNEDAMPRAFLAHNIEFATEDEMLGRVTGGETNLRTVALVDANDEEHLNPWTVDLENAATTPISVDKVDIKSYSCNKVVVDVAAAQAGVLVLTDQYFPGWKARVDGNTKEVGQVDYAFRGVAVPAGKHKVEFTYFPESFDKGLRLMKVALVLIAGVAFYVILRFFEDRKVRSTH